MDIQVEKRLIELKEGSFIFEFNDSLTDENCNDMIERFENSSDQHYRGRVGQTFKEEESIKKSLNQKITFPTLHSGIGSFAELLQRFHFI